MRPTSLPSILLGLTAIAAIALASSCAPRRGLPATGAPGPVEVTGPQGTRSLGNGTYTPPSQVRRRASADDPRVSRSRGTRGGVVLLWPRVIPSVRTQELRYAAQPLQAGLYRLIAQALPGRPIDSRPEPERVCPQGGCVASSVGVVLIANTGGCAAVVQLTRPGAGPATQIPWAGRVTLKSPTVPFRQPAESYIRVTDFVPCKDIGRYLKEREPQVLQALRTLP